MKKIDLMKFYGVCKGDKGVRDMLVAAVEQGFNIIPFIQDGKKQYSIFKRMTGDREIAFNPILRGDWIKGFPRTSEKAAVVRAGAMASGDVKCLPREIKAIKARVKIVKIVDAFEKWEKAVTEEQKHEDSVIAKVLGKPPMKVRTTFIDGGEQLTTEELEARKKLLAVSSGIPVVVRPSYPMVIPAKLSASEIKLRKKALAGYVKPDTLVAQKNLKAQWAFSVAHIEEFLSIFQEAVFNVAANRMRSAEPVKNSDGIKHAIYARVFVTAFQNAVMHADGYRSAPDYCEVDYYFWISKGTVFFGCVLPGSSKADIAGYSKWNKLGPKWLKLPHEIVYNKVERGSQSCPEGVMPSYVRLLSFKPGQMVGVQEVARRMVKNPKERAWAISSVLNQLAEERKAERLRYVKWGREESESKNSGVGLIAAEREWVKEVLGFSDEHDDKHANGEMAWAAYCYVDPFATTGSMPCEWPWDYNWWKPEDKVRNLVRAGQLIAAEIDRLKRIEAKKNLPKRV